MSAGTVVDSAPNFRTPHNPNIRRIMPHPRASLILSFTAMMCATGGILRSQDVPAELTQARIQYQKEIDFATRPIRDRYVSRLDSMKRSLGGRGDARGAAAVQDEIDRVVAAASEQTGAAALVGVWKVTYSNGSTRRYTVAADGTVTFDEDGGKAISPKVGKISAKGDELLLDFQDGALERIKVSGKKLITEYFIPKAQYPGGQPVFKGSGTTTPAHK